MIDETRDEAVEEARAALRGWQAEVARLTPLHDSANALQVEHEHAQDALVEQLAALGDADRAAARIMGRPLPPPPDRDAEDRIRGERQRREAAYRTRIERHQDLDPSTVARRLNAALRGREQARQELHRLGVDPVALAP